MITNRITRYRIAAGLSPAAISNMFKIPYNIVEKWERGESIPPAWAEQQIINKLKNINPYHQKNTKGKMSPFQQRNNKK